MPTVEYFLVCRAVLKDIYTDEISFLNILEDISPDAFPYLIPQVIAVSLWRFDPSDTTDYQAILNLRVPGQSDGAFPMNFARVGRRFRAVHGILEIPVTGPGEIVFEVLLNGVLAATHTAIVHEVGDRESPEKHRLV